MAYFRVEGRSSECRGAPAILPTVAAGCCANWHIRECGPSDDPTGAAIPGVLARENDTHCRLTRKMEHMGERKGDS